MKKLLLMFILALSPMLIFSQEIYRDFEINGIELHDFGFRHGILDTTFSNMDTTGLNESKRCAKYVRNDTVLYDVVHLKMYKKLSDVSNYSSSFATKKIKIKMFTDAPVGTPIHLQLGSQNDNSYPSGVHSTYETQTTVQNEWEELIFNFIEIPMGSMVSATNIDRISLLFNPAPQTIVGDTFYFDDLTGPNISDVSINKQALEKGTRLDQNYPNPASDITSISFELNENTLIELDLIDINGKKILTLAKGNFMKGPHSVTVNVNNLSKGIYMYQLQTGTSVFNKRLIVL